MEFSFPQDDCKILDKDPQPIKQKDITATHISRRFYCVFRVGTRYHTLAGVKGFETHMERKEEVLNADSEKSKFNQTIKGSSNITDDLSKYLKDVKVRKNSVLATSMLLTASHEYFVGMLENEKQKWIDKNIQWLNKTFGEERILYISSHEDERTLHLNVLFVPKVYDKEKCTYKLANKRFFGNKQTMGALQDSYGVAMSHVGLSRGIKGSKATHLKIGQYYALLNKQINPKDIKSVCAKALNSELLEKNVYELKNTLHAYKEYMERTNKNDKEAMKDNLVLYKNIKELQGQKKLLGETIKAMSKVYKIPEKSINQILSYAKDQLSNKDTCCLEKGLKR